MNTIAEVTIEADENLPITRLTRDFAATPAQLLRAHTDPAIFARWVGPNGMDTRIVEWDARTGGACAWLASGMEVGVNEGYAKLDELLADATV